MFRVLIDCYSKNIIYLLIKIVSIYVSGLELARLNVIIISRSIIANITIFGLAENIDGVPGVEVLVRVQPRDLDPGTVPLLVNPLPRPRVVAGGAGRHGLHPPGPLGLRGEAEQHLHGAVLVVLEQGQPESVPRSVRIETRDRINAV